MNERGRESSILPFLTQEDLRINRSSFIEAYIKPLETPLPILSHGRTIPFGSIERVLSARHTALDDYLFEPNEDRGWGRTVFSEAVSAGLLSQVLRSPLLLHSLRVLNTTTALDASRPDRNPSFAKRAPYLSQNDIAMFESGKPPYYQKGADLVIVDDLNQAILGIDVTMGGDSFIKAKREKVPIQSCIGIPVIVVGLKNFTYPVNRDMHSFLDGECRSQVLNYGSVSYENMHWDGLPIQTIKNELYAGIRHARKKLSRDYELQESYPLYGQVMSNLQAFERMLQHIE